MSTKAICRALYKKEDMKYYMPIAFSLTLLLSCSDDGGDTIFVEEELQVYFDSFILEASAQGYEVSSTLSQISAFKEELDGTEAVGQCKTYSDGRREIVVDLDFWERADHLMREYVVFHELGHCVLDREHLDEQNRNGTCVSIMESGTGGCRSVYTEDNRSQYLDELFNY